MILASYVQSGTSFTLQIASVGKVGNNITTLVAANTSVTLSNYSVKAVVKNNNIVRVIRGSAFNVFEGATSASQISFYFDYIQFTIFLYSLITLPLYLFHYL